MENLSKLYFKEFLRYTFHKNKKPSVLIIEPTSDSHGEVVPYYIKYFLDKGYIVNVIVSKKVYDLKWFLPFEANKDISFFIINEPYLAWVLKLNKLFSYKYILFTSHLLYKEGGFVSIFNYYPQIQKYKDKLFVVSHHMEYINKNELVTSHNIVLADLSSKPDNCIVANPHYFGEITHSHKLFPFVNFVVIGDLMPYRRNEDILTKACLKLVQEGITNFKITHIGAMKFKLPKELKPYFEECGRTTADIMYEKIENSNFIVTLFDYNNQTHHRYLKTGTSGTFQLVYGFLKPCLINSKFSDTYGFTPDNALVYEPDKLYDTMKYAINMTQEEYNLLVSNLKNKVEKIELQSQKNMDKVFEPAKKIKLLFDAKPILDGIKNKEERNGIFFVAQNIFNELKNNNNVDLTLFSENNTTIDLGCKTIYQNKKNYYKKYDAFLSVKYEIPEIVKKYKSIKKYTILHDLIPLILKGEPYEHDENSWFMKLYNSINKDNYYICVSENTKKDFIKHNNNIDNTKIFTVPIACDKRFKSIKNSDIKEKFGIKGNYILCHGNIEPRKNQIRIVQTFAQFLKKHDIADLFLVISGTSWHKKSIENLRKTIKNCGCKDKIIMTGYVSDEELIKLYSSAEWFVFTSQYEGFGLPVLEAMKCGCPVITSKSSSLKEVAENSAILIDWDSDEEHIDAYEKLYFLKEIKEKYIQNGLNRAKEFSYKKCVDNIINIIWSNND